MSEDRQAAINAVMSRMVDIGRQEVHRSNDDEYDPELPNPEDVLSIDVHHTANVLLTYGGPTVFVAYRFDSGYEYASAEFCTTDTPSGAMVRVELTEEEAHRFADAYCHGIDMLTEQIRPEQHVDWH